MTNEPRFEYHDDNPMRRIGLSLSSGDELTAHYGLEHSGGLLSVDPSGMRRYESLSPLDRREDSS